MLQRRTLGERLHDIEQVPSNRGDAHRAMERLELVGAVHKAIANLERPYREVFCNA